MARNTRLTPYNEQMAESFDENDPEFINDSEFLTYESTPSRAVSNYPAPEDPMPLFLSNHAVESKRRGFGAGREIGLNRASLLPRILKIGLLAASAAAIASVIVSVENPLALFANARASLTGSSADQSAAAPQSNPQPTAPLQLASSGPPAPPIMLSPSSAQVAPTRDDIALALKAAHQGQAETTVIQPPPAAAPPSRRMEADELEALLKRAKSLIAMGDIAPARLLLERAADAQEARAALMLAQTYDPAVLGTPDMRSITPDPALARDWYQKAARLGSPDAKQRLAQMQN
jgi:hypothetical protein